MNAGALRITSPRLLIPAQAVPLLYLGTAHVSLALACFLAAWWPRAVAGFFYHSWMVGLVHLVTLGWITFSILGAIYIVGPAALQMPMPARRADYVAYGFAVVGLAGMVSHFWLQRYDGMAWSAATVAAGAFYVVSRVAHDIRSAGAGTPVKLHITFACVNFMLAASMGLLIGFDKTHHFLPGYVLSNVYAHAHLAALGWATMMVVGVGYRMLPMALPSRMPAGRSTFASAVLLETGVLGLFVSLLFGSAWTLLFGGLIVAGLAAFAGHVIWMVRSPAPKPPAAPRIDFGVLHAAAAGVSLLTAAAIGVTLLVMPMSSRTLPLAAAYGVFGLLGFLSQMVVAMEARLLPLASWYWAYVRSHFKTPPPSPLTTRDRTLQAIVFAGWTAGVPSLAAGLYLESPALVASGAWALFAAVAIGTIDNILVVMTSR
ncbi:MAG: hypothetical protein LAO77_17365 [Acidobacteriia bacterium]|nr:hypothetical protein [Terriglobia bacterium]